jgi:hypothetical protein
MPRVREGRLHRGYCDLCDFGTDINLLLTFAAHCGRTD